MVEGPLSVDDLLQLLGSAPRRHLLDVLDEVDRSLPVATLVEHVARRLYNLSISQLSADRIRSVRIQVHHNHLPKLADAAVIEHDRESDSVRTGPRFERAIAALTTVRGAPEVESMG